MIQWTWMGKGQEIENFVYLGAAVSKEGGGTQDIHNRVVKPEGYLWDWGRSGAPTASADEPKSSYTRLVKPVLMYGCETWKMNKSDGSKVDVFQNRCLRRIFRIRWQNSIINKEVPEMADKGNLSEDVERREGERSSDRCGKDMTMPVGLQWRGHQKGTGSGVDLRQHRGEQQRRMERERSGAMCPLQRPTELVRDRVSRPCAPLGVKKLGEGDDYPLHW